MKIYRYSIFYYIFNCGLLKKFPSILQDLFRTSNGMPYLNFHLQLWTAYTGTSLILEKLFSTSSFHMTCFSILASGSYLADTITSENILRKSSIDAIIFNCGALIWCFLYRCFSCFRGLFQQVWDSAYNITFKFSFIVVFFQMVHNEKLFKKSNVI